MIDTSKRCTLVAVGVAAGGQPFTVTTAPGWPAEDMPGPDATDEDVRQWQLCREVDEAQVTPRQEELK